MNFLNFFTNIYGHLHNYKGVPYWVLSPFRRVVRGIANWILPRYLSRLQKERPSKGDGIIVSITSFPGRIKDVWKVVESLKSQSIQPERILLWLSKEQFPDKESVPQTLWNCEDDVFKIRFVDDDIRSHKKYYYAMQEFPDKTIVTCDDDIYYHPDMLKYLVKTSSVFPNCIVANISKQILFNELGELLPYEQWEESVKPYAFDNRVQIGAGGVLYPRGCLSKYVFRKDLFVELAPLADDLWLNMMARINKTPVVQTDCKVFPLPVINDAPKLTSVNNGTEKMNDVQIRNMRKWLNESGMPDVYSADYHVEKPTEGGVI